MPKRVRVRKPDLFPPRRERRGAHRIAAPPDIRCELAEQSGSVQPKNISASGIAVWHDAPLPAGTDYELTITFGSVSLRRRARIMYARKDGSERWLLGLKFLAQPDDDGQIDELIKMLATEFRPG